MTDHDTTHRLLVSPYATLLSAEIDEVQDEFVRIRIPFREDISNPGGALHGGVMASAIGFAATAASLNGTETASHQESSLLDLTVHYLAAAIQQDIFATATVLRRGKELTYCRVDVGTDSGKAIATGLAAHRLADIASGSGLGDRQSDTSATRRSDEQCRLVRNADFFVTLGFIARLGMQVRHAEAGEAILTLPAGAEILDAAGALHEGALAALIDTTGALASWTIPGLNFRNKASTVALHANFLRPARGEVEAHARVLRRNNETYASIVDVAEIATGRLVASGTVTYRIVIAE